jgi:tetratricopeptide (TPR) repeat protein
VRFEEAWYQENALLDLGAAAARYRSIAEAEGVPPTLAVKALLRLAFCHRQLGDEGAASAAELKARRRFPAEIKKFPVYRLEVLHEQLDQAFDVGDADTASQAIEKFLEGLDVATVHSICDSCYAQAQRVAATNPLASVPLLRKAIAISAHLRQLERSAFAQKDIGDIYAAAGRCDEATAAYQKTQQYFPDAKSAGAWAALGIAEIQRLKGRLPEAVETYRAAIRNYPTQTPQVLWAYLWMGDAYRAAGKMADAQSAWRRVLEDFNEPAYALQMTLAARLLGKGGTDENVRFPADEFANDLAYFLAVQYAMAGQPAQARRFYERCIELSRGNDWPRPLAAQALQGMKGPGPP